MKTKLCSDCHKLLELDQFFLRRDRPGKHRLICRECSKARYRALYRENDAFRDRRIKAATESTRRRRERPEVKEAERVASREAKRRELSDPAKRQAHNERGRLWRAENDYRARFKNEHPALKAARTALRIARQKHATPPWADLDAIAQHYFKAERLTLETGIPHEVDHIWPLSGRRSCGLHVSWNLQVIPAAVNRLKGNKEPAL